MADPIRNAAERLLQQLKLWREDPCAGLSLEQAESDLRTALAAAPPAPEADAALSMAAIIRSVDGSHSLGAAALADAILSHPAAASVLQPPAPANLPTLAEIDAAWLATYSEEECRYDVVAFTRIILSRWGNQPPAPAPAPDHIPDATKMVPAADGEREELAQWMEDLGDDFDDLCDPSKALVALRLSRAAALLRQPAPAPTPVADRPWKREGWCADWGWCWVLARGQWVRDYPQNYPDGVCLPHWAIPIPQPPQGGEVER